MGYAGSFNYRFSDPLNFHTIAYTLIAAAVFSVGVAVVRFKKTFSYDFTLRESYILIAAVAALILQSLNMFLLGGIPLFDSQLKAGATTNLWRIAYPLFLISINLLIAKHYKRRYVYVVLAGALIFAFNGYRTSLLAILSSVFINLYYQNRISKKFSLVFMALIIIALLVLGYIASQSIAGQHWTLNPVELIFYRAAFTLEVFEKIIPLQASTHGQILSMIFSPGSPRTFIGNYVLHYNVCLTSTMFGPVMLDFGFPGLLCQMFIMGVFLSVMHKVKKGFGVGIYSMILAHTLIWIETGPTDIMIWFLYLIALIYIIKAII